VRFDRRLRYVGWALVLVAGEALWVQPLCFDPGIFAWWRMQAWLPAYLALALSFHAGVTAREGARRQRLVALAGVVGASLAMQWLIPCEFGAVTVLLVAALGARALGSRATAALVAAHALVTATLLMARYGWLRGVSHGVALLAGGLFAAVAVDLARRLAEASRTQERTRLARELHDVLGHDLTALGLQLEVATHVPPERAAEHIATAREVTARLLRNVRDVAIELRDDPPLDLADTLRALAHGAPGLAVHLAMPEGLSIVDPARSHCLLRCAQEILTNTLRHARAQNLWITVAVADGAITLEAYDDGRGVAELRAGQGLTGMRARLEELGGRLRIAVGEPARAFAVSAWLPTKEGAS
jgi:signal transduction histidine kinase